MSLPFSFIILSITSASSFRPSKKSRFILYISLRIFYGVPAKGLERITRRSRYIHSHFYKWRCMQKKRRLCEVRCIAAVWVKTLLRLVVYHAENNSQKRNNSAADFCKDILRKPAKAANHAANGSKYNYDNGFPCRNFLFFRALSGRNDYCAKSESCDRNFNNCGCWIISKITEYNRARKKQSSDNSPFLHCLYLLPI